MNEREMAQAVRRQLDAIAPEQMDDPRHGTASWRMLFSGDRTDTDSITCGVATVAPGQPLSLHRHAHAEVYYGLLGEARAFVGNVEHVILPGTALFIPGNIEHGLQACQAEVQVLFIFAADDFKEVVYVFPDGD